MTKIIKLKSGSECGKELSDEYKQKCKQKFEHIKTEDLNFFSNKNISVKDMSDMISGGVRFSYCRFSDGEYLLMFPKYKFVNSYGVVIPGKKTKLGENLHEIISYNNKNFKIGVVMQHLTFLPEMFLNIHKTITQTGTYDPCEIWPTTAHGPFESFVSLLKSTNLKIILVANENTDVNNLCVNIKEFFPIPTQGIDYYENNSEKFKTEIQNIAVNNSNSIFIISAGMLANVVCYEGWKVNKSNWYIDIGSGIHNLKREKEIK